MWGDVVLTQKSGKESIFRSLKEVLEEWRIGSDLDSDRIQVLIKRPKELVNRESLESRNRFGGNTHN